MSRPNIFNQNWVFLIIVALLAFSCQQSTQSEESSESSTEEPSHPATKYLVTPATPSPDYPDAKLQSMEYKDGNMTFQISGESYRLGMQTSDAPDKGCANSGQGQHIHLIVDNEPYAAKYESRFEYEIPDGKHYLLAFLSRSYHESIKSKDAAIAVEASIKDRGIEKAMPISGPMLFYSRPKGTYEGTDTRRVLLDYYLVNPNPSYQVKALINGEEHLLPKWQPYLIEGLPAGENTIVLTLVDEQGKTVDTPLNPVTRKFVLNPEPPAN